MIGLRNRLNGNPAHTLAALDRSLATIEFDLSGKILSAEVEKVVKFATVITGRVDAINQIAAALERLAANDLTCRLDQPIDPQFQKVRDDLNRALAVLDETMSSVTATTGSVGAGADEISIASDDLSRRTEQQAASLEETAAALDDITATVNRSAEGARQASVAASSARPKRPRRSRP